MAHNAPIPSSEIGRYGLASYPAARANATTAAAPSYGAATKQLPSSARGAQHAAANAAAAPTAAASTNAATGEVRPRLSGGKRDLDQSAATDTVNPVQGSTNTEGSAAQPPQKKKKITYALPSQNMEEGHFYVVLGEDIDVSTGRFKILSLLGEGTFGKVVEAWDRKRKEYCAVKIVRNIPKYSRDAEYEIRYMERIRQGDPNDRCALMKLQRHFKNDQGHVCICMPKYGPCLLDNLQKNGTLPYRHLAEVIFQAGYTLDVFHSEMKLMHTDLKLENMLLESNKTQTDATTGRTLPALPCNIRICDLGGTCDENHSKLAIVSTRHYRSPEAILGLGWMYSTDLWSMGCIIYELFTGKLLYDTHDNLEHLHLMEKTLSRLPLDWAPKVRDDCRNCFTPAGTLRPVSDAKSLTRISRARPVRDVIQDEALRDLIIGCLHYDRSKRYTARQMSMHPFVQKYYPESLMHPMHPKNRGAIPPPPPM